MKKPTLLLLSLLLSVTLVSQEVMIALTGADCFSCDISLNTMLNDCLSEREVLFVFPESFEDARHWSKDLKNTYTPHIFDDSLFRSITGGYPVSVMATTTEQGQILQRYVVKQTDCNKVSFEEREPQASIDSLDFNRFMTGYSSSISRGNSHFVIIGNGNEVHLLDEDEKIISHFEVTSLADRFESILSEIGFSEEVVQRNHENKSYLGGKLFSIVNARLNDKDSTLRMLATMFHIEAEKPGRSSIAINQIQVVIDYDIENESIEVSRLPFSVPDLSSGHYYSLKFSRFISWDSVLVRNSIGSAPWKNELDGYGILDISDVKNPIFYSWRYKHPAIVDTERQNGITPIQLFRYYDHDGELYMHIARDSVLVPLNENLDSIHLDLSMVPRKSEGGLNSRPWLEKVLDYRGEMFSIVVSTNDQGGQSTLILNSEGKVLDSVDGPCYFAGEDDGKIYLHKYPVTGVLYTVDLNSFL